MRYFGILFITFFLVSNLYGQENNNKSLTLSSAIELGLKNNPTIKAAEENISASKGRFWSGVSLPQPELSYDNQWIPIVNKAGAQSEKTLSISQSLEFPSVYFLKGNKLSKDEKIAVYKLNAVKRCVIAEIKSSYFKVLAKEQLIKSAKDNLKISEDFFKKAEIRLNVGEGTNLERLTAKVQFTEAQINLDVIKNELSTAFAELNYSIGYGKQKYDSTFTLADTLTFVDYKLNIEDLYKSLEESNPEIKIAELNSDISVVEKSIAWSSLLPNINLAYFKQSRDGGDFYGTSAGISVPLWFMLEQKGKIQEAKANQSISDAELQSTKNELALKLQSAVNDYENNLKQVKLYVNDVLPQTEEIFSTATKSYDAGEITYIEYMQAKQTLISSQNNYINVLLNHYQSLFGIEEIVGKNIIDK